MNKTFKSQQMKKKEKISKKNLDRFAKFKEAKEKKNQKYKIYFNNYLLSFNNL